MSKVLVNEENLTNIANAIREKNGTTTTYKPGDMASAISSIETGGGSVPEKGIVINEWDKNGYATDVSIVGMTEIPIKYFSSMIGDINNKKVFTDTTVHLPDNVTKIGNYAFSNCTHMRMALPNGLIEIGMECFINSWIVVDELPSTLTKIGNGAFKNCSNVTISKLPEGLMSLGSSVFNSCKNITTMEIPTGIVNIYSNCLASCGGLEKVHCKGDIVKIYDEAFRYDTNLTTVILSNVTTVPTLGTNVFSLTKISNNKGYIYVPDALVDSFKSATNWSTYADQIKPISELEVA